jgi:hypothetical protein
MPSVCLLTRYRAMAVVPTVPFELPDGSLLDVGGERFCVPELYFNPASIIVSSGDAVHAVVALF